MVEDFLRIDQKSHKITHNSKKNRGSTPILTNLVEVHPRNIPTIFEANPCRGFGEEVENVKSLRRRRYITHNSFENEGNPPILTNLVDIHLVNLQPKFEVNPSSIFRREVENVVFEDLARKSLN